MNVYTLVILEICLHPWHHHHNIKEMHVCHLQKFPCVPLWGWRAACCFVFFYSENTYSEIYPLKCLVWYRIVDWRHYPVQQTSRRNSSYTTESHANGTTTPISPSSQSLVTMALFSASQSLIILGGLHKCHAISVLLWPAYLTEHNVLQEHLCFHKGQTGFHSFFRAE